jgi:hypothetical protein
MAKDSDRLAGAFEKNTDKAGSVLSGFFAEENEFDRRALWRIGSWGVGAVAAVTIAVMANQTSLGWRREQVAAADFARQAQQIQSLAKESQVETRRLASAIDTLNGDRDRLYSRVTVLEQGLESVTGAIARQNSMAPAAPAPVVAKTPATAPGTTPATGPSAPSPAASSTASSTPPADQQPAPKKQAAVPAVAPVATTAAAAPPEKPRPAETPREMPKETSKETPKPEQAMAMGPPAPQAQAAPSPPVAAPGSLPMTSTPLVAAKSIMGPPDPAASKLIEPDKVANVASAPAATPPAPDAAAPDAAKEEDASKPDTAELAAPEAAVQRTDFAVDLGTANSIGGLRALWRGLVKSNAGLAELRPIIMIKESHTGLGMQLRLAAGPLKDAAAAAKICAELVEGERKCETTVFDGQRLALKADEVEAPPAVKPMPAGRPSYYYRRGTFHHSRKEDPPTTPPKKESSTFSSLFGINKH